MEPGRLLALDIGKKRTGVAISDENQIISSPLKYIDMTKKQQWLSEVQQLVNEFEVKKLVVGLPYEADGTAGKTAQNLKPYIALLQEHLQIPVIEWDESFTTVKAEETLIAADVSRKKRKGVVDKIAAAILLQNYIDQSGSLNQGSLVADLGTE